MKRQIRRRANARTLTVPNFDAAYYRVNRAGVCVTQLRTIANDLSKAGCYNAAQAVRRALKSVEGAHRHAVGVYMDLRDQLPREVGKVRA
jgi:hypothetical protein